MTDAKISGTWGEIVLLCGNHEERIDMTIQQGPSSLFYACPHYFKEKRNEEDKMCINRISLNDFDKMLAHINNLLVYAELNGEMLNLQYHKWSYRGIDYEILVHNENKMVIKVLNKKALLGINRY